MELRNWDGVPQSRDDIHRKFNNTNLYAIVPDHHETKPVPLWISDFDDHNCRVIIFDKVKRSHQLGVREWRDIDVVMAYPPTGAIPYNKTINFITRNPARQWQVGWSQGNTAVFNSNLNAIRINNDFVPWAYTPEYSKKSLDEVLKDFSKDTELEAWAISPRYWLKRNDNSVALYRNRIPIGSFSMGTFFINKLCSDFKQELWDDLRIKVR